MSGTIITMTRVYDPFDRANQDTVRYEFRPGDSTLADLVTDATAPVASGVRFVASINGKEISPLDWADTTLLPGQHVTLVPVCEGSVLNVVLRVVVAVVAAVVSVYAGPYAGAAVMAIGNFLVSTFVQPSVKQQTPALLPGSSQGMEQSNSYSWNPQTTQQQGVMLPEHFGICKLNGNIIGAYRKDSGDTQYLNVLISLGEGPLSDIYDVKLNGQPLSQYPGVSLYTNLGRMNQSALPNFADTITEYPYSLKVVNGSPAIRTTIGSDFDGLEVEVTWPQGLGYSNDQGGLDALTVNYSIEVQREGEATWTPIATQPGTTTITHYDGKWSAGRWENYYYSYCGPYAFSSVPYWNEFVAGSTNPNDHYEGEPYYVTSGTSYYYGSWRWIANTWQETVSTILNYATVSAARTTAIRRTHRILGLARGSRYNIRVSNLTADQTSFRYMDDMYLSAVREIVSDDFTYPGEAVVGLCALGTDQISGGLSFECKTHGRLCRVYENGAWTVKATSNPAWVVWHILTQPLFNDDNTVAMYRGYDPSTLDLTRWVEWAAFCDDLVPDGQGGQEARLAWNGSFDSAQTLWDAVLMVATMGRAVPYWRGTTLTVAIDKPSDPVTMISIGNIYIDSFEETFLPMDGRAGSIEADFLNQGNDFNRDKFTVINPTAPAEWGSVSLPMQGEIRPSGVWRNCRYKLARTEAAIRTVSVSLGGDSIAFTLGDVILVQHDVTGWGEGGRLVSATTTTVTLDKSVAMVAGKNYSIMVVSQDGTFYTRSAVVVAGSTDTLTVSTPFPVSPEQYDVWAFGETDQQVKPMRVVGIDQDEDPLKRKITLEDYNASLYLIDSEQPLVPTRNYSPDTALPSVTNLTLGERLVNVQGLISTLLTISWAAILLDSSVQRVAVWAGRAGEPMISRVALDRSINSFELPVVEGETWVVSVLTSNGVQWQSINAAPTLSRTIVGKLAPPADVQNLRGAPSSFGGITLAWDAVPDLDLAYYEIRYSSATVGATWENAYSPVQVAATSYTVPVALDGSYLVKAVDTGGRESLVAAELVTTIPSLINFNAVATADDGATWPGSKSGTYAAYGKLYLDMAGVWENITDIEALVSIDSYGGALPEGFYQLAQEIDLGSVQTARCSADVAFVGINSQELLEDITDIEAWTNIDGPVLGIGVQPQISLSDDGAAWSAWQPFLAGDYTARFFRFRLRLSSTIPTNYPEVSRCVFTVDMPDRTERGWGVNVAAGGTAITFAKEFMVPPVVRMTILGAQSGDTPNIAATTAGATLQVLNGGVSVDRSVNWQAAGY